MLLHGRCHHPLHAIHIIHIGPTTRRGRGRGRGGTGAFLNLAGDESRAGLRLLQYPPYEVMLLFVANNGFDDGGRCLPCLAHDGLGAFLDYLLLGGAACAGVGRGEGIDRSHGTPAGAGGVGRYFRLGLLGGRLLVNNGGATRCSGGCSRGRNSIIPLHGKFGYLGEIARLDGQIVEGIVGTLGRGRHGRSGRVGGAIVYGINVDWHAVALLFSSSSFLVSLLSCSFYLLQVVWRCC
mmetsp:Transcript_33216/g.71860  ORF Transcript_33216/g.71860 Transcript_33216/m.71860 type:complete len:237 (+) Transcript_33216:344-1054(+)